MTYDPHAVPNHWQHTARPVAAKAATRPPYFDVVRVTRLAILFGLIGFWASVIMLVF